MDRPAFLRGVGLCVSEKEAGLTLCPFMPKAYERASERKRYEPKPGLRSK